MIDDVFVIDAVAHGYNLGPANQVDPRYAATTIAQLYGLGMQFVPEGYLLPYEDWPNSADPDLVARALFAESPTDFAIYHQVPMFGALKDDQMTAENTRRLNNAKARKNIVLLGIPSPTTPARSTQLGAVHGPETARLPASTDTLKPR